MNVAIIPARGGSKRIPRKNIRSFHGRAIIDYPIKAALDSGCFDHVVVSTDDVEIAEIALKSGAQVPFVRPAQLSNDTAGTLEVIKHGIDSMEKSGQQLDYVCCIYPATPMLSSKLIREGLELLQESSADFAVTVTLYEHPVQRALYLSSLDSPYGLLPMYPEFMSFRSQDLPDAYHDAGQYYWGRAEAFRSGKNFFSGTTVPVIVDRSLYVDIDHEDDWRRAEHVYTTFAASIK